MNSNFTQDLAKLEEYSLAMIAFMEKLPESFFEEEHLQPSKKMVDNIINYSKNKIGYLNNDGKQYRFSNN